MKEQYDVFISYKRKNIAMADNLCYRLSHRGYTVFYDKKLKGGRYDSQLFTHIEDATDFFVILDKSSLNAFQKVDWGKDVFMQEIKHALENGKNIIPILLDGCKVPDFDEETIAAAELRNLIKTLFHEQSPHFEVATFEHDLDEIEKKFMKAIPILRDKANSEFQIYSNEDCQMFVNGDFVGLVNGGDNTEFFGKPSCFPVFQKGEYQLKFVKSTRKPRIYVEDIEENQIKPLYVIWEKASMFSDKLQNEHNMPQVKGVNLNDILYQSIKQLSLSTTTLPTILSQNDVSVFENNHSPLSSQHH